MNSALYSGWISHRRFSPRAHAFTYRIGLLYLDLDEQDAVMGLSPLAGSKRFAPFSFRERDYLPQLTGRGVPLIEAARELVGKALGHMPLGRVCLLTQARSWGLSFNPVSFFYCHEADGTLAAILCEVTNTRGASVTVMYCQPPAKATSILPWPRPFTFHRSCHEILNTA